MGTGRPIRAAQRRCRRTALRGPDPGQGHGRHGRDGGWCRQGTAPDAIGKKKATKEAVLAYLAGLEGATGISAKAAADPFATLRRVTMKLDTDTVQAALERDPDGTRAMVRELIEALSSSVGIEVEIKSASPESAAA
ncbi:hypothetical protein GCM10009760_52930 [Kitasatospora kazusensis]|uniref:DNA-binding protein n=2 Tax=Kitasatospora kazusensis TaxID=407974 RepID=A0ABN3A667_9ACTN